MPLDGAARAALIALIENSAKQAVLEGSGMPKPPSLASAAETQYVPPTEALLQGTRAQIVWEAPLSGYIVAADCSRDGRYVVTISEDGGKVQI